MDFSVMDLGFEPLLKSGCMKYRDFLDFCADIDVDGIELQDRLLRELDESDLSEWLRELDLRVASIDIVTGFVQADGDKRRQGIEYCKKIMDLGHRLDARQVMIVPVGLTAGIPMESARLWTFDGLMECVDYGEGIGIKSTVENPLYRYPTPLPETIEHMIEVVEEIPKLGICYDDSQTERTHSNAWIRSYPTYSTPTSKITSTSMKDTKGPCRSAVNASPTPQPAKDL